MSVERRAQQPGGMAGGPMGRGPMGALGRPVEKPKDFKGTLKRFLEALRWADREIPGVSAAPTSSRD